MRVLCVDDHALVGEMMELVLSDQDAIESVTTVTTGHDALEIAEREHFDVVLMDYILGDADGIEIGRRIKEARPTTRVVMMTGDMSFDALSAAAAAGLDGFVVKTGSIDLVVSAITSQHDGIVLDLPALARLADDPGQEAQGANGTGGTTLTPREREVLLLLSEGHDSHSIARQMGITRHTCRGYLKNLMQKLGAHTQLQAVVYARRAGLITERPRRSSLGAAASRA